MLWGLYITVEVNLQKQPGSQNQCGQNTTTDRWRRGDHKNLRLQPMAQWYVPLQWITESHIHTQWPVRKHVIILSGQDTFKCTPWWGRVEAVDVYKQGNTRIRGEHESTIYASEWADGTTEQSSVQQRVRKKSLTRWSCNPRGRGGPYPNATTTGQAPSHDDIEFLMFRLWKQAYGRG